MSYRNIGSSVQGLLRPDCENVARTIKMSGLVMILVVVINFIILAATIGWNYMKQVPANDTSGAANKKARMIGGLILAAGGLQIISLMVSVWQSTTISRAAKTCLALAPTS